LAKSAWQSLASPISLALLMLTLAPTLVQGSRASAQSAEGVVRFDRVSYQASPGATFPVVVELEDLDHRGIVTTEDVTPEERTESNGLAGFELAIRFDPAVVTVERAEVREDVERSGRNFTCVQRQEQPDYFQFACFSQGDKPDGPQGTMALAEITLRAVGPGRRSLELEAQAAGPLGDDIPLQVLSPIPVVVPGPTGGPGQPTSTPGPDGSNPLTPTAIVSENDNTPSPADATATADQAAEATVIARRTPTEGDPRGGNNNGGGGSASAGDIAIWSLAVVGIVIATGGLAIGAVWWRRRTGGWQPWA